MAAFEVVEVVAVVVAVVVVPVVVVVSVVVVASVVVVVVCVVALGDVVFFCWRAPLVGLGLPWFGPLGFLDFVGLGLPLWLPVPTGADAPKLTCRVAAPPDPVLLSVTSTVT